jgi:WhiB family transcriptional regulator, redox-sensing transcriptional regulator
LSRRVSRSQTGGRNRQQERHTTVTLEVTGMSVSFLDVFTEVATSEDLPCRSYSPELFFAESPADVEYAKSLCQTCPLIAECLAGALERSEPWGVWGGQLFVQGVVVPRKRPRGRPRKSETVAA